jgi:two-component system LytT family sensor kinase
MGLAKQGALGVATAGIWLADFAIMMSRALIRAYPHQVDLAIRRAIICVFGLLVCQLIYWVLRRYAPEGIKGRVLLSAALSAVGSLLYATFNTTAYFIVLPRWGEPQYGVLQDVVLVFGIHVWVYVACVTVYWILHYSDELVEKERRLAETQSLMIDAQNRMLRYQINPHFLFNTLNALSTLILQRDNSRAEKMVLALSAFLRRSLEKDPVAKVTLAEEIEAAKEYLALEELRFGDRLNLQIVTPDSLEGALTPSLILQPLIENAVKYGVSACSNTVTIEVVAEAHGDRLTICVKDDGPGDPGDQPTLGVGLQNVRKRLEAIYGKAGRVEWGPTQPHGFRVSMELPLERHEQAA